MCVVPPPQTATFSCFVSSITAPGSKRPRGHTVGLPDITVEPTRFAEGAIQVNVPRLELPPAPDVHVTVEPAEVNVTFYRDHGSTPGLRLERIPVTDAGIVDTAALRTMLREGRGRALVAVMAANNETGTVQAIADIARRCRERGIIFHTDAAQAVGKIPLSVQEQNIDLLSICGHKLYAPKGVGALYVRSGINLAAQIDGGGHEHGMRSGTLNVSGIVGLGKACDICREGMPQESARISALRDRLRDKILASLDGVSLNGSTEHRLPGNLNMSFAGVQGEELLTALDDIAVSSGAACTSAHIEPSYVLKALGISDELAQASLRFGIGRFNTEAEVDYVAGRVIETVTQLRELA